jgi:hypothetical protein
MPRPHLTTRSIWRILGSLMVVTSVAVLSPTAAFANRSSSPYAFEEEPDTPGTDVAGTDTGRTTPNLPQTSAVVNPAGPAGPVANLPTVAETDVPGEAVADPRVNPRGIEHGGLAHTGAEGLTLRIAFAMVLVAIGLLAKEASRRRRVLAS